MGPPLADWNRYGEGCRKKDGGRGRRGRWVHPYQTGTDTARGVERGSGRGGRRWALTFKTGIGTTRGKY